MKIVVDDKIPFIAGAFESAGAGVVYLPGKAIDRAAVVDADALVVRTRTRCDAALLAGSAVRCVATATIGFDHLDTAWLEASGVAWSNAPGCNADSVANYIVGILAWLEDSGKRVLAGATLGVVGSGEVGSRVARLGRVLGMRVLECDPPRRDREGERGFTGLAELLAESDVVTLHVPRSADGPYPTENMADAAWFEAMKPAAYFINSSRGEVVDEGALKAALRSRRIAGAFLDVWRDEPLIDLELLGLVEAGTPHIAGYSTDGKANGTMAAVRFVGRRLGLGLRDWRPSAVPEPAEPDIVLPGAGQLAYAVSRVYDFRRDAAALRACPENFEVLRGDYPLRREFTSYRIVNPGPELRLWREMGFQL